MKIKIIKSYKNAHQAKGLTVVIDVLRAFTTACFVLDQGVTKIIAVAKVDEAKDLIKKHPDYISIGERKGLKIPGFDYSNSPAEISSKRFDQKTVLMTTTSGTKGIQNATYSDEIITGAFVNAQAIISYIQKKKPNHLSFICTDDRFRDNEDYMLAKYIISYLDGKPLEFEKIKKHLINHPIAEGFLYKPLTKYSKRDFDLSLNIDTFDFVIKVIKDKHLARLIKHQ